MSHDKEAVTIQSRAFSPKVQLPRLSRSPQRSSETQWPSMDLHPHASRGVRGVGVVPPLSETQLSQYCRENLGIDEYQLSPFYPSQSQAVSSSCSSPKHFAPATRFLETPEPLDINASSWDLRDVLRQNASNRWCVHAARARSSPTSPHGAQRGAATHPPPSNGGSNARRTVSVHSMNSSTSSCEAVPLPPADGVFSAADSRKRSHQATLLEPLSAAAAPPSRSQSVHSPSIFLAASHGGGRMSRGSFSLMGRSTHSEHASAAGDISGRDSRLGTSRPSSSRSHHGATGNTTPIATHRDRLPTFRALSSVTDAHAFHLPKRAIQKHSSTTGTGFFNSSSHFSRDDITKLFTDICSKIEAKTADAAEEKAAHEQRVNFKNIVTQLLKTSRPVYNLARKYVKDKVPSNSYRLHLRSLWRYAVARVITEQQKQRANLMRDAKKKFLELIRLKKIQDAKHRKKERGELAVSFFNELLPKRASKVPPLTENVYRSIRARFRDICDNEKLQLTVRDLSGMVDAVILRRIDRDHSGVVDFFELLKMVYPSILVRDLQSLMRKWDHAEADANVKPLPTAALLSDDSKRQIEIMFRQCDLGGKGVITKQEMTAVFKPEDWDGVSPLWFDVHFPLPSSVVSYDEFMEMVKFCYPPFRNGGQVKSDFTFDLAKYSSLPADLLEAQERAKLRD